MLSLIMMRKLGLITLIFLSSCLLPNEKGKVSLDLSSKDQEARDRNRSVRASVDQVKLVNDEIVITGSDLDGVTKVKVTQSGSDSLLSIVSKSATKLILSSSSKVALALNTLMTLTLEDAYGAAVIEVTFNLPDSSVSTAKIGDDQVTTAKIADGAITSVKLSSMGAITGQLLRWNGSSWVAADLDALTYAGTWDASLGGNPNPSAVGGEYYIVSNDGVSDPGDGNSRSWSQGDWIVYNDVTASWDQISNSSDVTSFNGRTGGIVPTTGDYTWAQIDKSTSSIGDIGDIDLSTAPTTGQVLKFDGTRWIADTDNDSGVSNDSVTSTSIADGSIVDADVSGSAAIAWSKIDKTGATNSDVGLGNVDNIQQMPLSYLDQTATLGTDANKVPSQNAVKTYVDNATSGMGSVTSITGGAALSDGPYTTTGTIDVQVDDSTIEVASDALQLKNGGITNAKINASAAIAWSKIDKTGASKTDVGLGNVDNIQQMPMSYLDQTATLGTDPNKVPSQNAVKTYVDNQVGGVNQSQWTTTGSDIYYDTGDVGIGLTTTLAPLHVRGMSRFENSSGQEKMNIGSSYVNIGIDLRNSDAGTGVLRLTGSENSSSGIYETARLEYSNNSNRSGQTVDPVASISSFQDATAGVNNGDLRFSTKNGTTLAERMIITDTGHIGVGTDTPESNLHVIGSDTIGLMVERGSGAWSAMEIVAGSDTGNSRLLFNDQTSKGDHNSGASGMIDYEHSDDSMNFRVNSSTAMRILSDGKVGIGTSTPSTELEVAGTITASGFNGPVTSSSTSVAAGSAASPSYTFSTDTDTGFYSGTADTIEVSVGGTNIFDMSSTSISSTSAGGGVLRTVASTATTPTFSFAGDEDTGWFSPAADELAATTGASERVRIDSSGNVGIGTTSPTGKLDIVGDSVYIRDGNVTFDMGYRGNPEGGPDVPNWIESEYGSNTSWDLGLGGTDFSGGEPFMMIHRTGNVGIGISAPSEKLEVIGNAKANYIIADRSANSEANFLEFNIGATDQYFFRGYNAANALTLGTAPNGSAEIIRFEAGGDVGIGTTNPTAKLDVSGTVKATSFDGPITSSTVTAGVGSAAAPSYTFSGDPDTGWYHPSANTLAAATNGAERLRIENDGTVNVSSTGNPSFGILSSAGSGTEATLTMQGARTSHSATIANIVFNNNDGTGEVSNLEVDGDGNFGFMGGNVGIGTASPADDLDIAGSSSGYVRASGGNGAIFLKDNSASNTWSFNSAANGGSDSSLHIADDSDIRVSIDSSGQVGIGTASPDYLIDANAASPTMRIRSDSNDTVGATLKLTEDTNENGAYIRYQSSGDTLDIGMIQGGTENLAMSVNRSNAWIGVGKSTDPRDRFDLEGGAFRISRGSSGSNSFVNPAAEDFRMFVQNDADNANPYGTGDNSAIIFENQDHNNLDPDDGMYFVNTGSDNTPEVALSIKGGGNVGIGTTTPSRDLTIGNDTIRFSGNNNVGSIADILFKQGGVVAAEEGLYLNINADGSSTSRMFFSSGAETSAATELMSIGPGRDLKVGSPSGSGESTAQSSSSSAGLGYIETPWVYAQGIEAASERAGASTGIALGNSANPDTTTTSTDEISLYTNGASRIFVQGGGNVGIGTVTPGTKLDVNGGVRGTSAYVNSSDLRFKKNIVNLSHDQSSLKKILDLNGYYFDWRLQEFPHKEFSEKRDMGVIAQEVKRVFPEAVVEDEEGYLSVAYAKLVAPLIESVKELFKMDQKQNREIASLKEENDKLQKENQEMKGFLCQKYPEADFCP